MSEAKRTEEEASGSGPNLTLFYGLIVLAMLAAVAIAGLIVLQFHHRH